MGGRDYGAVVFSGEERLRNTGDEKQKRMRRTTPDMV
jgi:hypothetical protein